MAKVNRQTKDSRTKVAAFRAKLRKSGLRPIQIWVPDTRAPGLVEALRKQVEHLEQADEESALDFMERSETGME